MSGPQTDLRRPIRKSPYGIRALIATTATTFAAVHCHAEPPSPEEAGQTGKYVDRLINDGDLEPILTSGDLRPLKTTGNLRSVVVEFSGARISSSSGAGNIDNARFNNLQKEGGVLVSGKYQTDNFGLLGMDAQLRTGTRLGPLSASNGNRWNGLIELTSNGLPLGSGWIADSALGTTTTPLIKLFDRQTRFFVPVTPIMGGAITFEAYEPLEPGQKTLDLKPNASFNLSVGEPGLLGGLRLADYTGLSGLLVSGGIQAEIASGWTAGAQAIAVEDTRDPFSAIFATPNSDSELAFVSSQALVSSTSFSGRNFRAQASAIWSNRSSSGDAPQATPTDSAAHGGSVDAVYRSGRTVHSGGLYYFGPGLTWGNAAILNNAYGGYYRLTSSSQRWRWMLNIDAIDSVDNTGSNGIIINADARRKIDFTTSAGINVNVRLSNGETAQQILGYMDFETKLGASRAEAGWSKDVFSNLYRIGFIQTWSLPPTLPAGSRISTQVSYQHRDQSEPVAQLFDQTVNEKTDSFGVAVSAGLIPFESTTIDMNIAYNSDASASEIFGPFLSSGNSLDNFSTQKTESFSANLVATVRLSSNWSLSGTYTDTTSNLTSRFGIPLSDPLLAPLPAQIDELRRSSFRLRAAYLTLRYSASAGTPTRMLGSRRYPVGGVGNIEGRIFLDKNANGARDPAEPGAPNIIVILDGIKAVRTDQTGYYRFESVPDGTHRVEVKADNLALPWFIEPENDDSFGQPFIAEVEVGVRGTATLDIAASRR